MTVLAHCVKKCLSIYFTTQSVSGTYVDTYVGIFLNRKYITTTWLFTRTTFEPVEELTAFQEKKILSRKPIYVQEHFRQKDSNAKGNNCYALLVQSAFLKATLPTTYQKKIHGQVRIFLCRYVRKATASAARSSDPVLPPN